MLGFFASWKRAGKAAHRLTYFLSRTLTRELEEAKPTHLRSVRAKRRKIGTLSLAPARLCRQPQVAIPAVGPIIKPTVDAIRAKLDTLTKV